MIFDKQLARHPWQILRSLVDRIQRDSLLRNSVYIMGTNATGAALGYLYWVVAAHVYSVYDVGLASALISVMMLASAFSNLGIGSTMVQMLPHREPGRAWSLTLNAGWAIGIFTGLLAGILLVVALPFFSRQFTIVAQHISYTLTLIVGVPLMTLSFLLDQVFVAERTARNMLLRTMLFALLKIPLMVLPVLLLLQLGALGIVSSWVLALAIGLIGGMLLVLRLGRAYCLAVRGIARQIRSMLSSLAGHHFINLGSLTPSYLLPVIVAARLSPSDNAYFYTTTRVGDFFVMGSSAVAIALFAEGSHAAGDLQNKVRSSAKTIGMILVPGMLICFVGGGYIMLLFGPGYAQHGLQLLRILIIAAVPDAITNIYISVLRVQRRLRHAALLNLGMASLDVSLAWVLLPLQGIAGAGWSFLIAQSVGSLVAVAGLIRIRRQQRLASRPTMQHGSDPMGMENSSRPAEDLSSGG